MTLLVLTGTWGLSLVSGDMEANKPIPNSVSFGLGGVSGSSYIVCSPCHLENESES